MCSNYMTLFLFFCLLFLVAKVMSHGSVTTATVHHSLLMLSISLQIDNINLLTHCIFIWRRCMPQQRDIYTIIQAVTCHLCHCYTWDVKNNASLYHLNNMCVCLEVVRRTLQGEGQTATGVVKCVDTEGQASPRRCQLRCLLSVECQNL